MSCTHRNFDMAPELPAIEPRKLDNGGTATARHCIKCGELLWKLHMAPSGGRRTP